MARLVTIVSLLLLGVTLAASERSLQGGKGIFGGGLTITKGSKSIVIGKGGGSKPAAGPAPAPAPEATPPPPAPAPAPSKDKGKGFFFSKPSIVVSKAPTIITIGKGHKRSLQGGKGIFGGGLTITKGSKSIVIGKGGGSKPAAGPAPAPAPEATPPAPAPAPSKDKGKGFFFSKPSIVVSKAPTIITIGKGHKRSLQGGKGIFGGGLTITKGSKSIVIGKGGGSKPAAGPAPAPAPEATSPPAPAPAPSKDKGKGFFFSKPSIVVSKAPTIITIGKGHKRSLLDKASDKGSDSKSAPTLSATFTQPGGTLDKSSGIGGGQAVVTKGKNGRSKAIFIFNAPVIASPFSDSGKGKGRRLVAANGTAVNETMMPAVPKPMEKPMEKPMPKPGDKPMPKPMDKPMPKPGDKPMPKPMDKPMPKPGDKPMPKPMEKPMPKPGDKPMPKPGDKPMPKPGDKPMPKPMEKPMPAVAPMMANVTAPMANATAKP